MADNLHIRVCGLDFPNPFVIGSGPPSTNARIICKAFDAGWGGVVAKTTALTDTEVVNVQPRYGKLKKGSETIGFQNIELISDRPFEDWVADCKTVKDTHPDRILIGSVMESFEKGRWQEVSARSAEAGCDGQADKIAAAQLAAVEGALQVIQQVASGEVRVWVSGFHFLLSADSISKGVRTGTAQPAQPR